MRTEGEVKVEYSKTLLKHMTFNHPKLTKLRKELKEIRNATGGSCEG